MSNITNKGNSPMALGSTIIPPGATVKVEDWADYKDRESIKAIIAGGGLEVGGKVTETEPEVPEAADAAPQGRRAVRG